MGDGASSSSTTSNANTSSTGGGGGGDAGKGGGGGETVVVDHGKRRSSCGYCRSNGYTSISHGLWAHSITVDDYQELLDRGWRRSGCFLYKPEMERMCCPSYTIRLKAGGFVPSKDHIRVQKKMQRYLDGKLGMNRVGWLKEKPDTPMGTVNLDRDASSSTIVSATSRNDSSAGISEKTYEESEFINYLSNQVDEAVSACVRSGEFPSTLQLPKAVVKTVTTKAKRKLEEISEDLLYTSSISFQIAAALRRSCSVKNSVCPSGSPNPIEKAEKLDISPNMVAEKLTCFIEHNLEHSGLISKACNGHLNFYSTAKQIGLLSHDKCMETSKQKASERKQSLPTQSGETLPCKRRRLEIRMKRSTFDPEEFALYRKYQIKVHDDKPEKVTESSYKRFLVDTPLVFVPPQSNHRDVPPSGFGSFHQQYVIDGKLVAVGVVDILPKCLSSKYLFWDPDLSFLSLGKYSALQEINWVKEAEEHCASLQYYYLGYYIHSCNKMRYKAAYHPSELLCPLRYVWVPFENARPLLDQRPYVVLSDYMTLNSRTLPPRLPSTSSVSPDYPHEENPDDWAAADIDNIMIDLGGSRVKFKDLQGKFGPIDKRYIKELEMQLRRYVRVVGQELSNRMFYSLG